MKLNTLIPECCMYFLPILFSPIFSIYPCNAESKRLKQTAKKAKSENCEIPFICSIMNREKCCRTWLLCWFTPRSFKPMQILEFCTCWCLASPPKQRAATPARKVHGKPLSLTKLCGSVTKNAQISKGEDYYPK